MAPPFWRASVRFVLKGVLGWLSFVAMAFTRRHQAIHDAVTHTTVQIRDLEQAAPEDYHADRINDIPDPEMPSPLRRSIVIALYSIALLAASAVALVFAVARFGSGDVGTMNDLLYIVWAGGTLVIMSVGWQGYLPGARRKQSPT